MRRGMKKGRSCSRVLSYQQIADKIRQQINRDYKAGDRLNSETTLAEEYGVSNLTIRQALTILEQEGILVKKQGSGSYVQEQVKTSKHVAIVSFLDILSTQGSYFFRRLAREVQKKLTEKDIPNRIYVGKCTPGQPTPDEPCEELFYDRDMNRLSGMIVLNMSFTWSWMNFIRKTKLPSVGLGDLCNCSVVINKKVFLKDFAKYLKKENCQTLAYIGYGMLQEEDRQTICQYGIDFPEELFMNANHPFAQSIAKLLDNFYNLREKYRPDALYIADENLWNYVLISLVKKQINVPEDLRLILHCNVGQELLLPFPVTLAELNIEGYAEAMVEAMEIKLSGRYNKKKEYKIPYTLRDVDKNIS